MKDSILQYVRENDNVSFAEFGRHISEFRGNYRISVPGNENVIIWTGMSEDAANLILDMIREKLLFFKVVGLELYWVDGEALDMPIAKSSRHYKREHCLDSQQEK